MRVARVRTQELQLVQFSLKMYFNTSLASIRDFYFGLECGTTGDQQTDINAESEQELKDHAWRSPLIFHIRFISRHFSLRAENLLTAYFNQLTFSVTLHMSFIIIFSPSLSQPTSLPPGSPSLFLFSIICQPFALGIKNVLREPGRLLSLCVRGDTQMQYLWSVCQHRQTLGKCDQEMMETEQAEKHP